MRKQIFLLFGIVLYLCLCVNANNITWNYVWNESCTTGNPSDCFIPWIATSDGKPKIDMNLLNLTANQLCLNNECINNWDNINQTCSSLHDVNISNGSTTNVINDSEILYIKAGNNISIEQSGNNFTISNIMTDSDTTYTAEEDLIYLDSTTFRSNESVLNGSIDSRVTQSFLEALGFNITSALKTYFDTLYQAVGSYISVGDDQKVTIAGENVTSGTIDDARIDADIARDSELINNCSTDLSCDPVAYDSEINKTYVDNQDSAQDECSEITNCVVGAITDGNTGWDNSYGFFDNIDNFTDSLTDTKLCIYNATNDTIQCDYTDQTGASSSYDLNISNGSTTNVVEDAEIMYIKAGNNISVEQSGNNFTITNNMIDTDTTIGNCSTDLSCDPIAYDSEINKTYVDNQDSAQDECSEITNCVVSAYSDLDNFTDSLTDTKLCIYNATNDTIQCDYTDQTAAGECCNPFDQNLNISQNVTHKNMTLTDGILTGANSEQVHIGVTDDYIDLVGSGGSTDQTLRFDLDDPQSPVISTTTGQHIEFQDYIQVLNTDSAAGYLIQLFKSNYNLSSSQIAMGIIADASSNGSGALRGISSSARVNLNEGTANYVDGISSVSQSINGDISFGRGVAGQVTQGADDSTIINARAFDGRIIISNSKNGTITNAISYYAGATDAEDSNITNLYQFYSDVPVVDTGNIANFYHLWLSDVSVADSNKGIVIDSDNLGLTLGAGQDAKIYYNGSDTLIDSDTSFFDGDITATSFSGDGSALTGVTATDSVNVTMLMSYRTNQTSTNCSNNYYQYGTWSNGSAICREDQQGAGSSDGTGGWYNTSTYTSTSMQVDVNNTFNADNITLTSNCDNGQILKWADGVGKCGTDSTSAVTQDIIYFVNSVDGGESASSHCGDALCSVMSSTGSEQYTFRVPDAASSFNGAYLIIVPDATETVQWDCASTAHTVGESKDAHIGNQTDNQTAVSDDVISRLDLSTCINGNVAAGDIVSIDFDSDTTTLYALGLEYNVTEG